VHANIDDFVMPEPAAVAAVADRLRLLADPTRLTILCALAQGETNPSCLADLTGVGVSGVSQHLSKLRLAGVCRPRRAGQQIWYELVDADVRALVRQLLDPATPPQQVTATVAAADTEVQA
jgi:DNA-binding transcriptional ArsR family regulator